MPTFSDQVLRDFSAQCFAAAGFPPSEAELIARLLVEANLKGHETHGVRQIPRYLELVRDGNVKAGAPVTIVQETPTTAVLDAHYTLGFVGAAKAVEVGLDKARQMRLAAVGVRNLNHVGRVGAYTEMIAAEGFVGIAAVNAQSRGIQVAPFNAALRRLGTNPLSAAFPLPNGPPVLLDFATSAVAANKVRQADSRGQALAPGLVTLPDGTSTSDPQALLSGDGALLPLGQDQGHKGYGLAVMVDILAGILAGSGTALSPQKDLNNGTFLIIIDPNAFLARESYNQQILDLTTYLRSTPPAPGKPAVEVPGDFESRHRALRKKNGIELEAPVWREIEAAAKAVGVAAPMPLPIPG